MFNEKKKKKNESRKRVKLVFNVSIVRSKRTLNIFGNFLRRSFGLAFDLFVFIFPFSCDDQIIRNP